MKLFYFLLGFSISLSAFSQQPIITAPGGVPGAVLWMKTVPETTNWNGNYLWKDFSGNSQSLVNYNTTNNGTQYIIDKNSSGRGYNFNPSIRLGQTSVSKEIQIISDNLATSTLIGVFAENELSGDKFNQPGYILTLNSVAKKGFIVSKDKIINSNGSGRDVLDYGNEEGYDLMYHGSAPTSTVYKEKTLRSFAYIRTSKPVTSVWGEPRQSHLSLGSTFSPGSIHNTSSYDTGAFTNILYDAYIPELFIYGRLLSPLERVKTESYLALKYGFMLEKSYIGSNDLLLWDVALNKTYNYRVAGLYRDDASGLYQRQASTSYEESPSFSYTAAGDSYDNTDVYSLSNRNKLLMVERFPSNTLQNNDYLIWGDNNQNLQTQKSDEYLGLKLMNRKWLVETNMGGHKPVPQQMQWISSPSMQVTSDGYKLTLKKPASATGDGTWASAVPLAGYEGHISFTLTAPLSPMLIKFGTQTTPETQSGNEYGIFINEKGEVYPMIHSVIQWGLGKQWSIVAKAGDRIRINKTKDSFIISCNGNSAAQTQIGQTIPPIPIQAQDQEKPFYASAGLYKLSTGINQEIVLKDFRTGGFIDTGNRIELSYIANRATEFASYKDAQAYLLVDHSGTGNFKKEDTELYLSDEYDSYRSKIVFNNVFFDPDNSGKDVFTFAYRESNLVAQIEGDYNCNLSSGTIQIDVLRGDEGFEYQLINTETGATEKTGVFFSKGLTIKQLSNYTTYTLKLKEIGGMNTVPTNPSLGYQANSQYAITASTLGSQLETTLKKPQSQVYQMGLSSGSAAGSALKHGFEINQGKIYIIENSVKNATALSGVELNIGDKLQVTNNPRGKVQYQLNGTPFYTRNADATYYYVMKSATPDSLYNVKPTGMGSYGWNNQNITLNLLSESQVEKTLTFDVNCGKPLPPEPTKPLLAESSNLVVYYEDFSDQSRVTARLHLTEPSPVSMAVFNLAGAMMYKQEFTESKTEHIAQISGLPQGMYILKFLSQQGEFTKKIILNY